VGRSVQLQNNSFHDSAQNSAGRTKLWSLINKSPCQLFKGWLQYLM